MINFQKLEDIAIDKKRPARVIFRLGVKTGQNVPNIKAIKKVIKISNALYYELGNEESLQLTDEQWATLISTNWDKFNETSM